MTMEHTPEAVKRHVKIYVAVFAALAVLTVATVYVSYLHLPPLKAVGVALLIATVKGSLVALFFMHLISERQIIFSILGLTVVFFAVLLALPALTS